MKKSLKFKTLGLAALPALLLGCSAEPDSDTLRTINQAMTGAGTVRETNVFVGVTGFNNDASGAVGQLLINNTATSSCSVSGSAPGGLSASTNPASTNGLTCDYVLSAETEAGGINYSLSASRYGISIPGVTGQSLLPVADDPDGTEVDLTTCAGLTQVTFVDCDGSIVDAPTVNSANHRRFVEDGTLYFVHRDGQSGTISGTIRLGSDVYNDTVTAPFSVPFSAQCDVLETPGLDENGELISENVVSVCDGSGERGALNGPIEVIGETLNRSLDVRAEQGPDQNLRYFRDTTLPYEAPESDPSSWWLLDNMVPGTYGRLFALGYLREGYSHSRFRTPFTSAVVEEGETNTPSRPSASGTEYPFVMDPAFIEGSIVLSNPRIAITGEAGTLGSLLRSADNLSSANIPVGDVSSGSNLYAYTSNSGFAFTSFPGDIDLSTGELASNYELPLPLTYDDSYNWTNRLNLNFNTAFDASEPDAYRNGNLNISNGGGVAQHTLAGGEVSEENFDLCFGEVTFQLVLAGGSTLYNPSVTIDGSYAGENGNGTMVDYTTGGSFNGYPRGQANSSTEATVRLTVPEGDYNFQPVAQVITAEGQVSTVRFSQTDVQVPCGGDITTNPGLAVSVELASACVTELQTQVDVAVNSGELPVDRVWYTVNGGAEIELCSSNCGADPSYNLTLQASDFQACANDLRVFASSDSIAGDGASTAVSLTKEIPGDGIDCPGSCDPISVGGGACLTGTDWVDVRDRTVVTSEIAAGGFELGADAVVNGDIEVDGGAFVRERGDVNGTLSVEGSYSEQNLVTVDTLVNPALVDATTLPSIAVAAGSGYQEVPNDSVETLNAGTFGHMTIRARSTVTLTAGVYSFASLTVEPDVTLIFDTTDGAVDLQSAGNVTFESRIDYQIDNPDLFSVYSNGSNVRLHPEQTFPGSILAPSALVEIYSFVDVIGCVGGRQVRIEPDSSLVAGTPVVVTGGGVDECEVDTDCSAGSCVAGQCVVTQDADLSGSLTVTSNWETGYCANVSVDNASSVAASNWEVSIDLGSTAVANSWNTSLSASTGGIIASPVSYNSVVSPGASVEFGFCASKSDPADVPVLLSVEAQ